MAAVAAELKTLDSVAQTCLARERAGVVIDEPLFRSPEAREQLLDFARTVILCPEAASKSRHEARSLYEVFDEIVSRGMWKEEQFSGLTGKLLNHRDPSVRSLFIDCLYYSSKWHLNKILKKNPNLPDQILNAIQTGVKGKTISQATYILSKFGKLNEPLGSKLIAAIEKNPEAEVLSLAACLFASEPDKRISEMLARNLAKLSDEHLRGSYGQAILKYLLTYAPSKEVVQRALDAGISQRSEIDEYKGPIGVLEAAIYVKDKARVPIVSFRGIWQGITRKAFDPDNHSEEAAIRLITDRLRTYQDDSILETTFKALKNSTHPAAKEYIQKIQKGQGDFKQLFLAIIGNEQNIASNPLRRVVFDGS